MPCLYENTGLIEGMTVVRGAECPLTIEKAYEYLTTIHQHCDRSECYFYSYHSDVVINQGVMLNNA